MGGPAFAGTVQLTARLVPVAGPKVGAGGAAGGSSASVTVTVRSRAAVRPSAPLAAVTVTE